jgi:tetratricopeptide (TPR) repeat protein
MDDKALARRCLEESLSISRQAGDRTQQILCLTHLGWLGVRLDNPQEALGHLQAGLALAQQIGSCTEQGWLHAGLAEAYRLAGEREAASVHAERALALAQETGAAYDLKLANQVLKRLGDT